MLDESCPGLGACARLCFRTALRHRIDNHKYLVHKPSNRLRTIRIGSNVDPCLPRILAVLGKRPGRKIGLGSGAPFRSLHGRHQFGERPDFAGLQDFDRLPAG